EVPGLLGLGGLEALYDLNRPDLRSTPWTPVTQSRLRGSHAEPADVFSVIRGGEVLVQHPYDSFTTSVEAFIDQASRDPRVLAIKQTLYRTSAASPTTANAYEDLGALSADPDLGHDVSELFNLLTGYSRQRRYRRLLVAPTTLRAGIGELIEREGKGPRGRIVIKVNNLVDPDII